VVSELRGSEVGGNPTFCSSSAPQASTSDVGVPNPFSIMALLWCCCGTFGRCTLIVPGSTMIHSSRFPSTVLVQHSSGILFLPSAYTVCLVVLFL
jgi:hypothetical protein